RGEAHIVDIGGKAVTSRRAVARAVVEAKPETVAAIAGGTLKKGDALAVARIAGIMAAKKTSELIPLCHPIGLNRVEVEIEAEGSTLTVTAIAETDDRTGVEMEAMTAAAVAALTLYDMAKSIDRAMRISAVELMEKSGGKSGHFRR
ncbi:MAG: cyclic pyranopterin monophosphate synthase MoaC, partial [Devosia sp.]